MERKKVIFLLNDGAKSYQKWKENKEGFIREIKSANEEGPKERSKKNRENAMQFQAVFEPYLKEILAQFS